MKILLFSDLHCHNYEQFAKRLPNGRNSRFQDCLNILAQIEEIWHIFSPDLEYVFFLGDLFHSRTKLDVDVFSSTFEAVRHLADTIGGKDKLFLLKGNHDEYTKVGDIHSLEAFKEIATVVDKPLTYSDGKISATFFPHTSDVETMVGSMNTMEPVDMLFFHQGVKEAAVGPYDMHVKTELSINDLPFSKCKIIAAGDYHKRQFLRDKKFHYVGSPLQLSMGEREEAKCFSIINTDTWEVDSVQTNAPRFYQLESPEEVQSYIEKGLIRPETDFVRLITTQPTSSEVCSLEEKFPDLQVVPKIQTEVTARVGTEVISDDKALLISYIEQQHIKDPEQISSFLEVGFALLSGDKYEC